MGFSSLQLEIEIAQLLAGDKGIKTDEQALKLSQFMVRAETTSQRLLLLNALAVSSLFHSLSCAVFSSCNRSLDDSGIFKTMGIAESCENDAFVILSLCKV